MAFRFDIVRNVGVISERKDHENNTWTKEVNLVSWNGREPKLDIREWDENHIRMSKGLTFTDEETEQVCMILHNYMRERNK